MSDTSFKFEKQNRTIAQKLFEPPAVGKMAPAAKVVAYTFLAIWSLFVLFPIYWVIITSFKGATKVAAHRLPLHTGASRRFAQWA